MAEFNNEIEWLRTCPNYEKLYAISAKITDKTDVDDMSETSPLYNMITARYVDGSLRITGDPNLIYYEGHTIASYRKYFENQNKYNIDVYEEMQGICNWLIDENNNQNYPIIKNRKVLFIEVLSAKPIKQWTDDDNNLNAFYVSYRLYFKNPAKRVDFYAD